MWESGGLPRLGESGSGYGEGLVRELTFTDILFYGQLLICMDVLFYVGFLALSLCLFGAGEFKWLGPRDKAEWPNCESINQSINAYVVVYDTTV